MALRNAVTSPKAATGTRDAPCSAATLTKPAPSQSALEGRFDEATVVYLKQVESYFTSPKAATGTRDTPCSAATLTKPAHIFKGGKHTQHGSESSLGPC